MKTTTINICPSWAATAKCLLYIVEGSSDFAGREWARNEIVRMGKIIDAYAEEDSNGPAPTPPIVND